MNKIARLFVGILGSLLLLSPVCFAGGVEIEVVNHVGEKVTSGSITLDGRTKRIPGDHSAVQGEENLQYFALLKPGTYRLVVESDGYITHVEDFTAEDSALFRDQYLEHKVVMEPSYTSNVVHVLVRDKQGCDIKDPIITMDDGSVEHWRDLRQFFIGVKRGLHRVTVSAEHYKNLTEEIYLDCIVSCSVEVTLEADFSGPEDVPPPVAKIVCEDPGLKAREDEPVLFDGRGSMGLGLRYYWFYEGDLLIGDKEGSPMFPSNRLTAAFVAGTQTITLKVVDMFGRFSEDSLTIDVKDSEAERCFSVFLLESYGYPSSVEGEITIVLNGEEMKIEVDKKASLCTEIGNCSIVVKAPGHKVYRGNFKLCGDDRTCDVTTALYLYLERDKSDTLE